MYSSQLLSQIAHWRALEAEGKLTEADYIEIIKQMREGRASALAASAASKRKVAHKQVKSADELLGDMLKGGVK